MSIEVLKSLQKPILKKLEEASIGNVGDILFAYTNADLSLLSRYVNKDDQVTFVDTLQRQLLDKFIVKDYFNTTNATKIQWALSRYHTQRLTPTFHLDVANAVISRLSVSRVANVHHQIYNEIISESIKKKKGATTQNQATQMFAQASVNFHKQEFFEQAFLQYKDSKTWPNMSDLGYMAQAAATLRRYEYSGLIVKWLDDNLSNNFGKEFLDRDQSWHLKGEFALAQTFTALAQIGADDPAMAELIRLARIE